MPISSRSERYRSVVVTGGAGFIGCALSHELAARVDRYVVVDNLHPQVHPRRERPARLHPMAELIVGDVTDTQTWDELLSDLKPDLVVHLAAETGTGQSLDESTRHALVNVVGTTQLLDAVRRHDHLPSRILLTSSRAVYGEGEWLRPDSTSFYPGQRSHAQLQSGEWDFEGATPLPSCAAMTVPHPSSVYGATKLAQENVLSAWCTAHSVPLTVLRLQNVYGPGQSLTNTYTGIVVLFARLAQSGKAIPLYEDGQVRRDFVHVDDVVSAISAALELDHPDVRCFDIGSGEATSIRELAECLADLYEAPQPVVTGQFRDGDVRHAHCSIEESVRALGWSPKWDLREGLDSLRDWVARA